MDLRTLLAVSLLLLLLVVSRAAMSNNTQSASTLSPAISTSDSARTCSCVTAPSATPTKSPDGRSDPLVVVLAVSWTSRCEGVVQIKALWPSSPLPSQICDTEQIETQVKSILGSVCHQKRGCSGHTQWYRATILNSQPRLEPSSSSSTSETICSSLRVNCQVKEEDANVAGQLQAYKTATALLCCVLLVLVVIRFTRPTIQALQKRLSDRRQNRWVGPTQSHSVSYNRGKNTVKNSDPEKRLSYPALERLTVAGSREPSSNRSSYNL